MTGIASSPSSWPGVSVTCNNSLVPWRGDCVGCCRETHLMLQDMAFRCYSHFPSLGTDTWTQRREHSPLVSPEITLVGHCQLRSVLGPWAESLRAVTSPSPWVTHRWQRPAQPVASSITGTAEPGTCVATRSPPGHPHKGTSLPSAKAAPKRGDPGAPGDSQPCCSFNGAKPPLHPSPTRIPFSAHCSQQDPS